MEVRFEDVIDDAMKLPARDRVRLAQQLISSLDEGADEDVESLWLAEAERRLEELRSGKATGVPAEEAFAKARDTLRR